MWIMKHFRAVYQLHVDSFLNFLMNLLFVCGRYKKEFKMEWLLNYKVEKKNWNALLIKFVEL
jgi:hypothetical protein